VFQTAPIWFRIAELLDAEPALYWAPGFVLLSLAAYLAIKPLPLEGPGTSSQDRYGTAWFLLVVVLCLLAFRWPSFLFLAELNEDESQLITNARKFLIAPIPWLHVDTTTSGPLNSYVLMVPVLFGLPISYPSTRIVGFLLLLSTLVFSYLTIRALCSERAARLSVLPSLALLGASQSPFLEFITSMPSISLLAAAVWLLARAVRIQASALGAYLAGLCLSAVPFAKIQAGPLAVLIFGLAFFFLQPYGHPNAARAAVGCLHRRIRLLFRMWFVAGGATVPLAMLVFLAAGDALSDAWRSYIVMTLLTRSDTLSSGVFDILLSKGRSFIAYAITMLLLGLAPYAWARWSGRAPLRENDPWIVASVLYLLATAYVVWKPGTPWIQYFLLFVHPLTLAAGLLWHRALGTGLSADGMRRTNVIAILAAVLFIAWILAAIRAWSNVEGNLLKTMRTPIDPVSKLILKAAGGDRHVAIWGYMPQYYVKTGLNPSTRDAMTQFQIQTNPQKAYYIQRYLNDIAAARPNVFVEATGKGNHSYFWHTSPSHSEIPELARIINEEFTLVYDIAKCGTPEARIYVRKSRLAELGSSGIVPSAATLCLD
jgi:hypothetical protein